MLYELFIEPWTLGAWMWRGTLTACLTAIPCGVLGVFLYLRRMSLMADALTHIALLGVVVAFLISGSMEPLPMLLGAGGVGVFASVMIESLSKRKHVRADAAIGIVFTACFALGVILLSLFVKDAHIDTQCVLFGDVLGVSNDSMILLAIVAPLVLLGVALAYRWLAVVSFDKDFARQIGIPVTLVHYGLMIATSMTTVASFEAVGAILAIAMIVVPAATAHLLSDRLPTMLGVSILHGLISAFVGMYVSIWAEVSSAGSIVVVGGVLYMLAFIFAPKHGVVSRRLQKRRARQAAADDTKTNPSLSIDDALHAS